MQIVTRHHFVSLSDNFTIRIIGYVHTSHRRHDATQLCCWHICSDSSRLSTAKLSCVVSAVWTSAVVTQFTISRAVELLRLVTKWWHNDVTVENIINIDQNSRSQPLWSLLCTPTRLNSTVELRRHRWYVLGFTSHITYDSSLIRSSPTPLFGGYHVHVNNVLWVRKVLLPQPAHFVHTCDYGLITGAINGVVNHRLGLSGRQSQNTVVIIIAYSACSRQDISFVDVHRLTSTTRPQGHIQNSVEITYVYALRTGESAL